MRWRQKGRRNCWLKWGKQSSRQAFFSWLLCDGHRDETTESAVCNQYPLRWIHSGGMVPAGLQDGTAMPALCPSTVCFHPHRHLLPAGGFSEEDPAVFNPWQSDSLGWGLPGWLPALGDCPSGHPMWQGCIGRGCEQFLAGKGDTCAVQGGKPVQ